MLPDEAIEEFRQIYKKEYGKEITKEEARELATHLLNFTKAVYRPIKKEWIDELKRKDEVNKGKYEVAQDKNGRIYVKELQKKEKKKK